MHMTVQVLNPISLLVPPSFAQPRSLSVSHIPLRSIQPATGIGEGVKIADLNGHLLLYSKDMRRIGRDYEVVYDAKTHQPVATLQKKMLTMVCFRVSHTRLKSFCCPSDNPSPHVSVGYKPKSVAQIHRYFVCSLNGTLELTLLVTATGPPAHWRRQSAVMPHVCAECLRGVVVCSMSIHGRCSLASRRTMRTWWLPCSQRT